MTECLDIAVLTLFPGMFDGLVAESMWKRALTQERLKLTFVNFRDFATDKHKTVDDSPFGGGAGMLLKPDPLFRAIESITDDVAVQTRVILLSPQGRPFTQRVAEELVTSDQRLVLVCGHYEGFDERIRRHLATDEVSLGDFVLTGGEIAAMAMIDTMIRLVPGVLGNGASAHDDSFASGLLEYPQYTRPADYQGWRVPPVLVSGNHKEVALWRRRQSLWRTWRRRPDLLSSADLTQAERDLVSSWQNGQLPDAEDDV
ncbi:tRNA (guanosine(37)-N1)-methyltransferase TrmD [Alicyclobacillus sp. ALC3]|uniref:tRNA (guanosine(37)-N1)-methyltransferase TrmD n=1 Tax=Alicyclobacillus sp. ALC3 TaxID=2796143 RepID=UPI002377DE5B|nr:tRNA (guanosine(37)-N1)-methyltransferase TrmD [Alicyclobacillus sp. ALC3]